MADTTDTAATDAEQQFSIQKIYVKDVSFESPSAPQSFTEDWDPSINLELNTSGAGIAEDTYEVVLSLTVTAKNKDKTAFLVEIQQAGIFTVSGFGEQDLNAMLGSFCPNILFPYAREAVSDLVSRGGFPQLALAPVNFDALYAQHLEELEQAGGKSAAN